MFVSAVLAGWMMAMDLMSIAERHVATEELEVQRPIAIVAEFRQPAAAVVDPETRRAVATAVTPRNP